MTAEPRQPRRAARARAAGDTHWELSTAPVPALGADALRSTPAVARELVLEDAHGLAGWRYRLPPGAAIAGPDPSAGGGQFWVVLAGTLSAAGSAPLGINSCVFVAPEDGPLAATAGSGGAEALCLQFRVPYGRRH